MSLVPANIYYEEQKVSNKDYIGGSAINILYFNSYNNR